jgi:RNA polymerase sigma-70 factor (ECF subfamily)
MAWTDISILVKRAQGGDRPAYGELVERFQPTVYAVALTRLRNPGEAQELTQEVFIHSMTKLDQLRDPRCFPGWLRQITVRMALNRLGRHGRIYGTEPEILDNAPDRGTGPLDALVKAEEQKQLLSGLTRLKATDRATLEAFYLQGRSLKQMSHQFETPIGTIKRRLHVARNRLRQQLERPRRAVCA